MRDHTIPYHTLGRSLQRHGVYRSGRKEVDNGKEGVQMQGKCGGLLGVARSCL